MSLNPAAVFVALADGEEAPLVPFYTTLFDQKPAVNIPRVYAEFHLAGLRLGIFQPKSEQRDQFIGRAGSMSLCVEVSSLEQVIDHLNAIGHPPASAIMTASHGREFYLYDPMGNRLILHESA
jgi:predicted enzyme related to lactoylglutathione lyase